MLSIGVEQSPDHALVLCVMFPRFTLKILNTSFAQRNGHFDSFIPKDEFFGARQEIWNDLKVSEGFVRIFYFPAHRSACLSASTRLQKFESRRRET